MCVLMGPNAVSSSENAEATIFNMNRRRFVSSSVWEPLECDRVASFLPKWACILDLAVLLTQKGPAHKGQAHTGPAHKAPAHSGPGGPRKARPIRARPMRAPNGK